MRDQNCWATTKSAMQQIWDDIIKVLVTKNCLKKMVRWRQWQDFFRIENPHWLSELCCLYIMYTVYASKLSGFKASRNSISLSKHLLEYLFCNTHFYINKYTTRPFLKAILKCCAWTDALNWGHCNRNNKNVYCNDSFLALIRLVHFWGSFSSVVLNDNYIYTRYVRRLRIGLHSSTYVLCNANYILLRYI